MGPSRAFGPEAVEVLVADAPLPGIDLVVLNRNFMTVLISELKYLSIPGCGFDAVGIQRLRLWDSSLDQNTLNIVLVYVPRVTRADYTVGSNKLLPS